MMTVKELKESIEASTSRGRLLYSRQHNKCSMTKTILLCASMVSSFAIDKSAALAFSRPFQPVPFAHRHIISARTVVWRLEATKDDGGNGENGSSIDSDDSVQNEEASLFAKINSFLDTPILDANNRSDQGAVAETLKRFVRREPQLASVTFSAVVVAFMFILVRLYNFISYGI